MKRQPPADLPDLVETFARMKAREDRLSRARARLNKEMAATAGLVLTLLNMGAELPAHLSHITRRIAETHTHEAAK